MPIYEPKDYEQVIARIQKKVIEKNIKMGECFSEKTIEVFEKNCNIQLPQAYRMFLKLVGNGCDHPDFHLNRLENIEQKDLSSPFMLEEVWNFTDVGVQPCCERQDFLGWFELWLDYQDKTDYFKDYVYKQD